VTQTSNPSTWEAEAGRSQIGGQPGKYMETLSQKKNAFLSIVLQNKESEENDESFP
jgi:hypothetical protein